MGRAIQVKKNTADAIEFDIYQYNESGESQREDHEEKQWNTMCGLCTESNLTVATCGVSGWLTNG